MEGGLDVRGTLREVFETYCDQAGLLLPIAFWLFLAIAIVDELAPSTVAGVLVEIPLSIVAPTLYLGMVVCLVRNLHEGRTDVPVGELVRTALPVLAPLIGAAFLAFAGIAVGFVLLVVPGLYLLTQWAVIAPAIVVERQGVIDAFGRSRELVRGKAWPVFWTILIAFVVAGAASIGFVLAATAIIDGPIVRVVFGALASTLTAPIEGLVVAVLYFRLRELTGLSAGAGR